MKPDDEFILIKYRKQIIGPDWIECKRFENYAGVDFTIIKAATMLEGIVKLLHFEIKEKYVSLSKEAVSDLIEDVTKLSSAISTDTADYDNLNAGQLYMFTSLLYSFYLFKFFFAKKKKLEEMKDLFGPAAAKRPMNSLINN